MHIKGPTKFIHGLAIFTILSTSFGMTLPAKAIPPNKYVSHTYFSNTDFNPKPRGTGIVTMSPDWLRGQYQLSVERMLKNISPLDARPGAIVAAQTRNNPNYYYHWVRDAALTMESALAEYKTSLIKQERGRIKQAMFDYINFSMILQKTPTQTGLGEPKFNPDGSAYNDPWGRPQNDGPALRALSAMHIADILAREGQYQFILEKLYDGKLPSESLIKKDLEYVAHHWRDPSFDLWEEVLGDHFYTRMVQRRALREGALFAEKMGDPGAARFYAQESEAIEKSLLNFWDSKKGFYVATINRVGGLDYKHSGLDSAFALALLHGGMNDSFMNFFDPKVQATLTAIENAFKLEYPINQSKSQQKDFPLAPAIGRYPEDQYAGNAFGYKLGNPWPLCTLAYAELYYLNAARIDIQNSATTRIMLAKMASKQDLIQKGNAFVNRVQYHTPGDGSLNEQIHRQTGYMTSVSDLTWSYAAVISTYSAELLL